MKQFDRNKFAKEIQRARITFNVLAPTQEIAVSVDGKHVATLGIEKTTLLATAANANRFGYLLEKETLIAVDLISWNDCFSSFQEILNQFDKNKFAKEKQRAEKSHAALASQLKDNRRHNEELQKKQQEELKRLKAIQEQENLAKSRREIEILHHKREAENEGSQERDEQDKSVKRQMITDDTVLAPLARALKSQFAMRNNEDQMFERVARSMGLPVGTLVIDPERLDLLRLESVPFDQETSSDRNYRKRYFLKLLQIFDNCCANCGSRENGIHLDHFMVPRSKGGTFIIYTKTGLAIHNAIPLCEPCNIQKSKRDFRTFFQPEILQSIFEKLTRLPDASELDLNNAS